MNSKLFSRYLKVVSALCIVAGLTLSASTYVPAARANSTSNTSASPATNLNIKYYIPSVQSSKTSCQPTGGSGGFAPGTYKTKIAGLNAIVIVGAGYNPKSPTFLSFHIHGDSGNIYQFERATHVVNKFVTRNGWIFVAPESPNGGHSWWKDKVGDHNALFAAVMDYMFSHYNVCRYTVFGSMGSGGSEFWTAQFFPFEGAKYPAHSVISCGGNDGSSTARKNIKNMGKDPHIVNNSTFYYVYGTKDYLYDLIQQSIDIYGSSGFNVEIHEIPGAGHCSDWKSAGLPTQMDRIVEKWAVLAHQLHVPVQ